MNPGIIVYSCVIAWSQVYFMYNEIVLTDVVLVVTLFCVKLLQVILELTLTPPKIQFQKHVINKYSVSNYECGILVAAIIADVRGFLRCCKQA